MQGVPNTSLPVPYLLDKTVEKDRGSGVAMQRFESRKVPYPALKPRPQPAQLWDHKPAIYACSLCLRKLQGNGSKLAN